MIDNRLVLGLALTGLLLLIPQHVSGGDVKLTPVQKALKSAAHRTGLPYELLWGLCKTESNLKPEAVNKFDGKGHSHGLCQIKLATARLVGFKGGTEALYNPWNNAYFAGLYLKHQLDRYKGDWIRAIAAYNRGSSGKRVLNKTYVQKVLFNTVEAAYAK